MFNGGGERASSEVLSSEGGAHAAADEDEHPDPAEDPGDEDGVEVVGHGPHEGVAGVGEGARADGVVLGEEAGAHGDQDGELEEAGEEGAVDGAHSPPPPPRADEHEEGVEADDAVGGAHQRRHHGELGALRLAVHVAVFHKFDQVLQVVLVEALVGDCDEAAEPQGSVPGWLALGGIGGRRGLVGVAVRVRFVVDVSPP